MSNNRYVILNCPTLMGNRLCYSKEIKQCADCTDCIMKQIVDILRENTCKPEECGMNKPDWNGEVYGCNAGFDDNVSVCSCALAHNLLAKFDIQEVE